MSENKLYRNYLENIDKSQPKRQRNTRLKTDFQIYSQKKLSNQKYHTTGIDDQVQKIRKSSQIQYNRKERYFFPEISKPQSKSKEIYSKEKNNDLYQRQKIIEGDENMQSKQSKKMPKGLNVSESPLRKFSGISSVKLQQSQFGSQIQYASRKQPQFIETLMVKIKRPIDYESKDNNYIQKEKSHLVKLVKNLNSMLNKQLKRVQNQNQKNQKAARRQSAVVSRINNAKRSKTQFDDDDGNLKDQHSPSAKQFQRSLVQVVEELNSNQKLIENMENQYNFLSKKFSNYQNSLKNYASEQQKVQQLKQAIKCKKQEISRIRKKKFLTQKSIISIEKRNGNLFASGKDVLSTNCSVSNPSSQLLISLKEELSELNKKKGKFQQKIELTSMHLSKIEELKLKNNVNKQNYKQLVEEMKQLNIYEDSNVVSQKNTIQSRLRTIDQNKTKKQADRQHINLIYNSKKSKLQLLIKTVRRQEQAFKKKYFNLLKQYEALVHNDNDDVQQKQGQRKIPLKKQQITIEKLRKQHFKNIESKLIKTKLEIQKMDDKILRFKKVGKIIKKRNHSLERSNQEDFLEKSNYNESEEQEQQQKLQDKHTIIENSQYPFTDNSMIGSQKINLRYQNVDDQSYEKQIHRNIYNPSKKDSRIIQSGGSSNTSFNNYENQLSYQHIPSPNKVSKSSYLKTPSEYRSYENIKNSQISSNIQNQNIGKYSQGDSLFLTQDDYLLTEKCLINKALVPVKGSIRQNKPIMDRQKYIGKFKKQKVLSQIDKKKYIEIQEQQRNSNKPNFMKQQSRRQDGKAQRSRIIPLKVNVQVIQQQIQGTSDFESRYNNQTKTQSIDEAINYKKQNVQSRKINKFKYKQSPSQWQNEQTEEKEYEASDQNVSLDDQNENYQSESEQRANDTPSEMQAYYEEFSKQLEQDLRQEKIQKKYAQILYTSHLFNK